MDAVERSGAVVFACGLRRRRRWYASDLRDLFRSSAFLASPHAVRNATSPQSAVTAQPMPTTSNALNE